MATWSIFDESVAGTYQLTDTNAASDQFRNGQDPYASPNYALNPALEAAQSDLLEVPNAGIGAGQWPPSSLFSGAAHVAAGPHTDFHFRLWAIPSVFRLSNPQIGVDNEFTIWNTSPVYETEVGVSVVGSSVLSFDWPSHIIRDKELHPLLMQIAAGESTVNAVATFTTTNLTLDVQVIALIADTFNLIPNVPVRETWNFLTDVLENYQGTEQRIALRRFPRITTDFRIDPLDDRTRREQGDLLRRNIQVQSLVPQAQYATYLTADVSAGATRVFFDPARTNMRAGEFILLIEPETEDIVLSNITSVEVDGVIMDSATGFDLTSAWVAIPALNSLINDGSGIKTQTITGTLSVKAESFTEPTLLRPNATRTIDTFDSLPWVDRRPMPGADELQDFRRDVIDNSTGVRDVSSRNLHPKVAGKRAFLIQRLSDPDELDYWRSLFDTTRGGQVAFLLSTWLSDLTLAQPFGIGTSIINVNQGNYPTEYFPYSTWKHIQMEFAGGLMTQHTVTSATTEADGTATLIFTPALPVDDAYSSPTKISYLLKVHATDKVALNHFETYTEISFGIQTTDS